MKNTKKYGFVWMWIIIGGINAGVGFIDLNWFSLFSFIVAGLCLYWAWTAKKDADRHEKRMAEIQELIDRCGRRYPD